LGVFFKQKPKMFAGLLSQQKLREQEINKRKERKERERERERVRASRVSERGKE